MGDIAAKFGKEIFQHQITKGELLEANRRINALESEKAGLERGIREWQSIHKQCFEKLRIATEALKEMPCMCPEALGYSKGDKCLVCTTIATIEGN